MTLSDGIDPNSLANMGAVNDPLAAGIPPLYDDRILDNGLPQPGSIDLCDI
jgi:hypothetical protein